MATKANRTAARLIHVKLAQAIDTPLILFQFGDRQITVTQKKTPIEVADFVTIQKQFPGWIEQVTTKTAAQPTTPKTSGIVAAAQV